MMMHLCRCCPMALGNLFAIDLFTYLFTTFISGIFWIRWSEYKTSTINTMLNNELRALSDSVEGHLGHSGHAGHCLVLGGSITMMDEIFGICISIMQ